VCSLLIFTGYIVALIHALSLLTLIMLEYGVTFNSYLHVLVKM